MEGVGQMLAGFGLTPSTWGDQAFVNIMLGINLAAARWKSISEELASFDVDQERVLKKAYSLSKRDRRCSAVDIDKARTTLERRLATERDKTLDRWQYIRDLCNLSSLVLIGSYYFGKGGPWLGITALPLLVHTIWRKIRMWTIDREFSKAIESLAYANEGEVAAPGPEQAMNNISTAK